MPTPANAPDVTVASLASHQQRIAGVVNNGAITKPLSRSYRTRRLAAEVAPDGDVLWINRPGELTAESSTAAIRKCADQLITGGDKHLQGRCCIRARRINAQSAVVCLVFGSCD